MIVGNLKLKRFKMKLRLLALTFLVMGTISMSGQDGLSVGSKTPLFKAAADDGSVWDISKYLGEKYIVVYFYPAAMTGGCTKQACSYRDHSNDLKEQGIVVVGISGDKTENLQYFKKAENLNFTLLSDEKGDIAKAFGVPVSEGGDIKRTIDGIEHDLVRGVTAKRWTFIVGKDKKIIYKNESVDPEKDTEEVLNL
jgi:thioredoxin-dependent peroxiredoxin